MGQSSRSQLWVLSEKVCKLQSSYFCSELKNNQEQWSLHTNFGHYRKNRGKLHFSLYSTTKMLCRYCILRRMFYAQNCLRLCEEFASFYSFNANVVRTLVYIAVAYARAYIPSNFVFFAVTSVTHKEKKVGLGGTNSDERRRKVENKLAFVVLWQHEQRLWQQYHVKMTFESRAIDWKTISW